jgi:hypothetical protein
MYFISKREMQVRKSSGHDKKLFKTFDFDLKKGFNGKQSNLS